MSELFTMEQIDYLDRHFEEKFNQKYVQIEDCNERQEAVTKRFANDDKRIDMVEQKQDHHNEKMESKLTFNNWLTLGLLGAIIGAVAVILFFGG